MGIESVTVAAARLLVKCVVFVGCFTVVWVLCCLFCTVYFCTSCTVHNFFFCISVFVFMQSLDFSVILLRVYLRSKRELKHFLGVERWVACSRPSLLDYSQCSRGCCQSMRLKTSFPSVLFEFQSARKLQKVVKI